jgi:hypothetical protein
MSLNWIADQDNTSVRTEAVLSPLRFFLPHTGTENEMAGSKAVSSKRELKRGVGHAVLILPKKGDS